MKAKTIGKIPPPLTPEQEQTRLSQLTAAASIDRLTRAGNHLVAALTLINQISEASSPVPQALIGVDPALRGVLDSLVRARHQLTHPEEY